MYCKQKQCEIGSDIIDSSLTCVLKTLAYKLHFVTKQRLSGRGAAYPWENQFLQKYTLYASIFFPKISAFKLAFIHMHGLHVCW